MVEKNEKDLVRKWRQIVEEKCIQRDVTGMVGLGAVDRILHDSRESRAGRECEGERLRAQVRSTGVVRPFWVLQERLFRDCD